MVEYLSAKFFFIFQNVLENYKNKQKSNDKTKINYCQLKKSNFFIFLEGLTALDIINQTVLPSRFKTY